MEITFVILPRDLSFVPEDVPASAGLRFEVVQVLTTSKDIRIEAKITDEDGKFNWQINSNIDELLSNRLKARIAKKNEAVKRQIKERIDAQIEPQKKELLGRIQNNKTITDARAKANQKMIDHLGNALKNKIK